MRILLAALIAAAVLVIAPGPAFACSCAARSIAQQVADSDTVGVGKVAWVALGDHQTVIAVEFTDVYKGQLGSLEKVFTQGTEGGGACAVTVAEGRRYVFFMTGAHRGKPHTDLCSGTTEYDEAKVAAVRQAAGPSHEPIQVRSTEIKPGKDWFPAWVVWLIITLGALGTVIAATYLFTPPPPWADRN